MELNVYAWIALAAILLDYLLGLVSRWLGRKALDPELPAEFADRMDAAAYRRSQAYARARMRFGLVASTLRVAAVLLFWFLGGFGWLDALVRGWGLSPVPTGLAYLGLLFLANGLVSLPLSAWSTFVLEERFGFNRTTPAVFVLDRLKGLVVGIVLGGPLLAALLAFFQYAGPWAWLYAWGATAAFLVVMQVVVPAWIMPLFNRFEPLADGPLRSALLDYADAVGFPLENVFVMDGSKRSRKSNAFFTGFGRRKRVALFDTLVDQLSVAELRAVVAHEIGHFQKGHIRQGTVIGVLHAGALFLVFSLLLGEPGLYAAFGVAAPSVAVAMAVFGLLYAPVELVLGVLTSALSRHNEYAADRFAAQTTHEPEALVRALKTLSSENLANLTPHPFNVALSHSHPPVLQRIRALRGTAETAASDPTGGDRRPAG